MRVLTLFSGTHSVGKVATELGWEEVSLDLFEPADIQEDILKWDWRLYPPGYFDIVWASPECKEYSRAKTVGKRKLGYADKMVKRTLQIINDLRPKFWFIENPESGMLKTRDFMLLRPRSICDYCKYGLPYRKRTALWSNVSYELSSILQTCKHDCHACSNGRHFTSVQDEKHGVVRGRIPATLLMDIFELCKQLSDV